MSEKNPILNSPYNEPIFHYRTLLDGSLDYDSIVNGRRPFDPTFNSPIPVKQGAQETLIDIDDIQENYENHLINLLRREVKAWRDSNYENNPPTRVTKELLNFWFNNPDRHNYQKLFFAQREAVETAIWINEIAEKTGIGNSILNSLIEHNSVSSSPEFNLNRIAFKMATGTGKTVVMAMIILYHFLNKRTYRQDNHFADYFLLVAPGITIKDRLGVLYVDTQNRIQKATDYYHERGLVPFNFENEIKSLNSRLLITNFHSFELRNLQGNKVSPFDGKIGEDGKKQEAKEDTNQMLKRVLPKFKKGSKLIILNDEAHHCYLPKEAPKVDSEVKDENKRASIWINGIAEISKKFLIKNVYDLSATPYYLSGSGYEPYSLFPWVVSDFGLIEAIEAGLVKIPFLPESDSTHSIDKPKLLNLYENVKDELPKTGKKTEKFNDEPKLPNLIKNALDQFVSHYKKEFNATKDIFTIPPVFIIVCNNTYVSSEIYKYIAGFDTFEKDEEGKFDIEKPKIIPGKFDIFSNYEPNTRKLLKKPPTLLIDSFALEDSNQINDDFKKIFAPEIEQFKKDFRITHPDKSVEDINEAMILREVLNTVGKTGKLGSHIRCVVSVNMLTEGWDANTVTHIMGVRAFGSQLLCEQVAGRALRRKSYELGEDGKFAPEYAHIIGVPFKMFKGGATVVNPPKPTTRVQAMPERYELEITFPQVIGYRIENNEGEIKADFKKVPNFEIDGTKYPEFTILGSAFLPDTEKISLEHIRDKREQELIYVITKYMISNYYIDDENNKKFELFNQLKNIITYWVRYKVVCIGDAFKNMLFYEDPKTICDQIMLGIQAEKGKHDRILPILNYYNKIGSTKFVNGNTSKPVYRTKKSHVNYVVADTESWEQIAAKSLEEMDEVICYVKNSFLNFFIPYTQAGVDRKYMPDFIAKVILENGNEINLIIEISGFSQDKEYKKYYVTERWLPSVNNIIDIYEMNPWYFVEISQDIRDIKNDIRKYLKEITNG